jgi:hypothetical protein
MLERLDVHVRWPVRDEIRAGKISVMEFVDHQGFEGVVDGIQVSEPFDPAEHVGCGNRETCGQVYRVRSSRNLPDGGLKNGCKFSPAYAKRSRIRMAAGARACERVLEIEAMKRKSMDIVRVAVKLMSRKKKKGPGSLRRLAMK